MTPATPLTRTLPSRITVFVAAIALLAGCSPDPEPTPAPTPFFASEEEAFAAAEETYRAYNDASNARRSGNAAAKPEDYLVGKALEADLEASDYLRSLGLKVIGTVTITTFRGLTADIDDQNTALTALVCLDSSETRVISSDGTDMTPAGRKGTVALTATMNATGEVFLIEDEVEEEEEEC